MAVRVIGLIRLKNEQAFAEYRDRVVQTIERYGGSICFRGLTRQWFWNELEAPAFDALVELEFPDEASAQEWAKSPEYTELLDIRGQAMSLSLFSAV
jgi:uncharacterized protein (DUF1330 family)